MGNMFRALSSKTRREMLRCLLERDMHITGLAKKVGNATIKITFYKKLEKVKVPLKLDVGLGL